MFKDVYNKLDWLDNISVARCFLNAYSINPNSTFEGREKILVQKLHQLISTEDNCTQKNSLNKKILTIFSMLDYDKVRQLITETAVREIEDTQMVSIKKSLFGI